MKVSSIGLGLVSGIISAGILLPAVAQVTSDGTTNTTVNTNGNNFTILNGIEKGNNLFHSFSNFSVPTNGSATFDLVNTPNITTIFSRVTGGNVSNVDGLIQTLNGNNAASLFLMNPNGIVFGENASLNIGGSFVGTTANSIKFNDGTEFSAVNPNQPPLLTMSVPVGLQMGQNPGEITVLGKGHQLSSGSFSIPPTGTRGNSELGVNPGNTLALIGGSITLDGGVLSGEAGQIELHGVGNQNRNSSIAISPGISGWNFDSSQIENFAPILLENYALIDTSGNGAGGMKLNGSNITVDTGSWILSVNQGDTTAGSIVLNATENFTLQGIAANGRNESLFASYATATGAAADIQITTPVVNIYDSTNLTTSSTHQGDSGDITIRASDFVRLQGVNGVPPSSLASRISTVGRSEGNAGNLSITTRRLTMLPGGRLSSAAIGTGRAGKITVDATESVKINTVTDEAISLAGISSENFGSATAGDILIKTSRLLLQNGAYILTSNLSKGTGGTININAFDNIEVTGHYINSSNETGLTLISAETRNPTPIAQQLFGVDPIAKGDAGNIILNTPRLSITDKASVSTANQGVGRSGVVVVNSDRLFLDKEGRILASTNSGGGGDIQLNLQDSLIMRRDSSINTESLSIGNGGNITINSPIILGLENSDIIANAFEGNGGNINITTQGIFGLENRDSLTDGSDITASSQFGVNGTVNINNISVDPSSGLVELPVTITDPSQQIASGCADTSGSSFIATGRGGIPTNPNQEIKSDRTWSDVRDISAYRQNKPVTAHIPTPSQPIVQATSWRRNADGKVELIADTSSTQGQQQLTCAAIANE